MVDDAGSNKGVDSFDQNRNFKYTACISGTRKNKKLLKLLHIKIVQIASGFCATVIMWLYFNHSVFVYCYVFG